MNKLVIIDGNAIIHRAYHAMPPLTTPTGQPIGAVQGFTNILLKIIQDMKPTHIVVAWDRPEPTFRNEMFKEYQSQREESDKELVSQFEKVRDVLSAFDISAYDKVGFEADDIIGTTAKKAEKDFGEVVIVTGDKDQTQLVTDKVKIFMPVKGLSVGALLGPDDVKEKMGVRPDQVIDLKGFMGDPSDNYPGVYGVGPKTAIKLLEEYDNYPNVYKHIDDLPENVAKKLKEGKENGDISFKLAKILTDVDVPYEPEKWDEWSVGNSKTLALFEEFGFRTLTKRVQDVGAQIASEKQLKLL